MHKKASTAQNVFLSLVLIAIVVILVLIVMGKITIPTSLEAEQMLSCKNSCQALGLVVNTTTDVESCVELGGTLVSGVDDCCCT